MATENGSTSKVKAIVDPVVLTAAKNIGMGPDVEYSSDRHAVLIFAIFKELGFLKGVTDKAERTKALNSWLAHYANGHLAFSSNAAKHLAASGLALARDAEKAVADYEA